MIRFFVNTAVILSLTVFLVGCQKEPTASKDTSSSPAVSTGGGHDHGHEAHNHEAEFHSHDHGPQGGILAILGAHQFHVEFMPDDVTGTVTAVVYNNRFKQTAVDAKELTLDIMVDGQPKQFSLLVDNDGTDGKDAVFKITDESLAKLLKAGWEGKAQVTLTVQGSPKTGTLVPLKK